ncbi:MAG: hypothetical protein JNL32_15740, partial [Candidatus Kapabacteria bacterium]|nr:hypothetical protein [Candidatus Kapabacteria bacterium]
TFSGTNTIITPQYPVISLGRITHNGTVNANGGNGDVILRGGREQLADGIGTYKTLIIDNPNNVTIINNGGFAIDNTLVLNRGEL